MPKEFDLRKVLRSVHACVQALAALICILSGSVGLEWGQAAEPPHIVFSRIGPQRITLYVADADGHNERPLFPAEGLDYNPSFSADGKWIVFTSERGGSADIYRVHPDGSGLEQLTDAPSYEDQAALSPNGRTLAFVSTRNAGRANIFLLNLATRQQTNLTQSAAAGNFRPSWSPDGQWLAFSSDRDAKPGRIAPSWEMLQSIAIYIVHPDGSGLRRLTELGGYNGSPQWSPDGRRILCYRSSPQDAFRKSNAQIVSIEVETGQTTTNTPGRGCMVSPRYGGQDEIAFVQRGGPSEGVRFTSDRETIRGPLQQPAWSPDGKLMVFQKESDSGPRLAPAFNLNPKFELSVTFAWMPAYAPDARQLAVVAKGDLRIMNVDGSHDHLVLARTNGVIAFPVWSPDGTQLAFGVGGFFDRPVKPGQIALIRPDGSEFRKLTDGQESSGFPSWSPDGKRLVYRVMGHGQQGLRILTLATGQISKLTEEYDTFPVWSPRDDRIAFCSQRGGDFDIYTMRTDGTDVRQLTNSHGNDAHPMWSPDGQWIMFSSSRMGFKDEAMLTNAGPQPYGELFVMRADGSEVTQLTDNQWEDATPTWRPDRPAVSTLSALPNSK